MDAMVLAMELASRKIKFCCLTFEANSKFDAVFFINFFLSFFFLVSEGRSRSGTAALCTAAPAAESAPASPFIRCCPSEKTPAVRCENPPQKNKQTNKRNALVCSFVGFSRFKPNLNFLFFTVLPSCSRLVFFS